MSATDMLKVFPDQQATLLDTLYAAPCEASQWQLFLEQLVNATTSRSARLLVMDRAAEKVLSSLKLNIDDSAHREYVEHFVNTCPWRPELPEKPPGQLYSTYLDFSCSQRKFYRTEFFNDWAGKQDIHHGVCGTVWQDEHFTIQLLIQRTRKQGYYSAEETAQINKIVPHLRRAIRLSSQIDGMRAEQHALAQTLDRRALPFAVLDREGGIRYLSSEAESIIADTENLSVKNGKLIPGNAALRKRLQKLLSQTACGKETKNFSAGEVLTIRREKLPPLRCLASPSPTGAVSGTPWQSLHGGLCVLYFHDPAMQLEIDADRLAQLLGLSEAESLVAIGVAMGHSPAEIAARRNLSVHTVRTQLKAIYRKTNCSRQSELANLIITSPTVSFRLEPPVNLDLTG